MLHAQVTHSRVQAQCNARAALCVALTITVDVDVSTGHACGNSAAHRLATHGGQASRLLRRRKHAVERHHATLRAPQGGVSESVHRGCVWQAGAWTCVLLEKTARHVVSLAPFVCKTSRSPRASSLKQAQQRQPKSCTTYTSPCALLHAHFHGTHPRTAPMTAWRYPPPEHSASQPCHPCISAAESARRQSRAQTSAQARYKNTARERTCSPGWGSLAFLDGGSILGDKGKAWEPATRYSAKIWVGPILSFRQTPWLQVIQGPAKALRARLG